MKKMHTHVVLTAAVLAAPLTFLASSAAAAEQTIDLAGPNASGTLAMYNFKTWASREAALQGTGTPDGTGLPDYPLYAIPGTDRFSSIIAEPLSATTNYVIEGEGVTVENKLITDVDFDAFSSGSLVYDDAGLTGVGNETVAITAVNLNTLGFGPIYSTHNDGTGFGNAGFDYIFNVSDITGTGVTFVDGVIDSIDLQADIGINVRIGGQDPASIIGQQNLENLAASFGITVAQLLQLAVVPQTYFGEDALLISGDSYAFDMDVTQSINVIPPIGTLDDTRLVFDRAGTIAAVGGVIPEPASLGLFALGGLALRRRR